MVMNPPENTPRLIPRLVYVFLTQGLSSVPLPKLITVRPWVAFCAAVDSVQNVSPTCGLVAATELHVLISNS
jgi:hypothetical protein